MSGMSLPAPGGAAPSSWLQQLGQAGQMPALPAQARAPQVSPQFQPITYAGTGPSTLPPMSPQLPPLTYAGGGAPTNPALYPQQGIAGAPYAVSRLPQGLLGRR